MQTVDGYTILDQYDTLKNLSNGVYASKMVSHDIFNKNFSETVFDYNVNFENVHHTEHDGKGGKIDNKSQLPILNYKDGKLMSDHADGTVNFVSTTKRVQNDYELPEEDRIFPQSMSQKLSFRSQVLSLDCKGFTGISVGDLCSFEVPSYEPVKKDNPLDFDPYMSGRYLIRRIHHNIDTAKDNHKMNLECVKDAVRVAYPEENIDIHTNRENLDAITYLQYQLDEALINEANKETHNEIIK